MRKQATKFSEQQNCFVLNHGLEKYMKKYQLGGFYSFFNNKKQ